jgi:hypothetical protein
LQIASIIYSTGANQTQVIQSATPNPDGTFSVSLRLLLNGKFEDLTVISESLAVIDGIDSTEGKFPQSLGNILVMDRDPAEGIYKRSLKNIANTEPFKSLGIFGNDTVDNIQISNSAMFLIAMIKNRLNIYNFPSIQRQEELSHLSSDLMQAVGITRPVSVNDVVNQALDAAQFIKIFIDEVFFTVLSILSMLATILIYALLMADVEGKTFEYGMLRSLGLKKNSLVGLLLMQAALFSLPGVVLGLLVSVILYTPIEFVLSQIAGMPMSIHFEISVWILGIGLGLFLPFFGTFYPLRKALEQNLRDSLDFFHKPSLAIKVKLHNLQNMGVSLQETSVSIILVVLGFLVYYVVPLSFTYSDLALFFRVFTLILLLMLVGQVMFSGAFQGLLELIMLYIITFMLREPIYREIVTKNLAAHQHRNQKTALMFTLCLSYVIFAAMMFQLQGNNFSQTLEWSIGADLVITSTAFKTPLPEVPLINLFSKNYSSVITGYTFTTFPLSSFPPVRNTRIFPVSKLSRPTVDLIGIQSNFLQVTKSRYFIQSSSIPSFGDPTNLTQINPTISRNALNSSICTTGLPRYVFQANSQSLPGSAFEGWPILIGSALSDATFSDVRSKYELEVEYKGLGDVWSKYESTITSPLTIVKKIPGFSGVNRLGTARPSAFVSVRTMLCLCNRISYLAGVSLSDYAFINLATSHEVLEEYSEEFKVPKQKLFIRLKKNTSALQLENIINGINSIVRDDSIGISNLPVQLESTRTAGYALNILFMIGTLLTFVFLQHCSILTFSIYTSCIYWCVLFLVCALFVFHCKFARKLSRIWSPPSVGN